MQWGVLDSVGEFYVDGDYIPQSRFLCPRYIFVYIIFYPITIIKYTGLKMDVKGAYSSLAEG